MLEVVRSGFLVDHAVVEQIRDGEVHQSRNRGGRFSVSVSVTITSAPSRVENHHLRAKHRCETSADPG